MKRSQSSEHRTVKARWCAVTDYIDVQVWGQAIGRIDHWRCVLESVGEQQDVARINSGRQLSVGCVQSTPECGGTPREELADLPTSEGSGTNQDVFVYGSQREVDRGTFRGAE